jgi:hypothetical protein
VDVNAAEGLSWQPQNHADIRIDLHAYEGPDGGAEAAVDAPDCAPRGAACRGTEPLDPAHLVDHESARGNGGRDRRFDGYFHDQMMRAPRCRVCPAGHKSIYVVGTRDRLLVTEDVVLGLGRRRFL